MWGTTDSVAFDKQTVVTLPTPFDSKNYCVIPLNYNNSNKDAILYNVKSRTSTNFTVYGYRVETRSEGTRYIGWIAIGD